ncbi:Crp/Fnr family transcriptional regulator [Pedobacter sp. MC2016-14]|uniref:Crp/Fnr family transcriptional regulator n=1 Tax=Pedobacter sp. MC2016-14 TaxID=2897327 RepID=UPI001E2C8D59|nr:Crp/Fnr family transcriptional regulator [Pedobacter sp. MC2016-14]MCD0489452.1 Crp/Fnr family transcriptional regulator [Pedobacter sp. MC2016-14]
MNSLIENISFYHPLAEQTKVELLKICKLEKFLKNEDILKAGESARHYYFVHSGLLGYHTSDDAGNIIYKIFFEENSFVASTASIINGQPSNFTITALEESALVIFPARAFRQLIEKYHDLALAYLKYLEHNWVIKKEQMEIDLKWQTAKERYHSLKANQALFNRLKLHQIASYLGITPTQLSRIRKEEG